REPGREKARLRLARALVEQGSYTEAIGHFEVLAAAKPDDPDLLAQLARCYVLVADRRDDARRTLDHGLAANPNHGPLLRARGQFALLGGGPSAERLAEAETWFRKAAAALPDD